MFFLRELTHLVSLQPSQFTHDVEEQLRRRLHAEVEGSFSGRFGYVISVVDVVSIGAGLVLPAQGAAQYQLTYRAIVFKPYKGEVLNALVSQVNQQGFMAEVGPVNVFVSRYLLPKQFKFNPSGVISCWSDDMDNRIERGAKVRLRIQGTQTYPTKIDAIGSIKEDYLGLI
ncbi:DNA-directed RNA polymerase II subunit [Allomyces javanicus]|nr:DNA-directed RNA polymerase II subunit [Allomyces javanicus]